MLGEATKNICVYDAYGSASATNDTDAVENPRGLELAALIDQVIQQLVLRPISDDDRTGGFGLVGWPAGNLWTISALANVEKLPSESLMRIGAHTRVNAMHGTRCFCSVIWLTNLSNVPALHPPRSDCSATHLATIDRLFRKRFATQFI